ncbi:histone deacetylase 8-like isoform X2 [Dreissena polymorpha]|uniref:histone deacetylase 8-like isoform X2 n=1 Tax=Dreissena polymorpha TaxID=45954 RepID=UPI002264F889|nr:histone deacetylase 8-like isoform X2 [Dreissena polymorpha]
MGSRSLSQEYDFPDEDDSPVRSYRAITKRIKDDKLQTNQPDFVSETNSLFPSTTQEVPLSNMTSQDAKSVSGDKLNPSTASQRTVAFMHCSRLIELCDKMLKIPRRASMVSSLIEAYRLPSLLRTVQPTPASFEDLCKFHQEDYLEFLQKISQQEDIEKYDEEAQLYGLSYDCPAHPGVYDYASLVTGATIQAAECLMNKTADIAINWFGGWHHGKKDSASGFCYTNDVVLGILKLREKFNRVLYIDLDVHHGVEDAFCSSNKVLTVSVHKHAVGFFPGTGSVSDVGMGKGKYYSVNIPLQDGIKDAEFSALVCRVLLKVRDRFNPEAVVCQCGADGLTGDPNGAFNLTPNALGKCVYTLLSWKRPLLLLGGGGYNHANTARCWAYLTAVVLGRKLPDDIPEHKYLMEYGPDYTLTVTPGNQGDHNTQESVQALYSQILYNLSQIS